MKGSILAATVAIIGALLLCATASAQHVMAYVEAATSQSACMPKEGPLG